MSKLYGAKSLAVTYYDEIESTIEIRQSYNTIVVGMSGLLMSALGQDSHSKKILESALRLKTIDPNAFYKAMVVQTHGVFENYIRDLVKEIVEDRLEGFACYFDFDQKFRNNYIFHAANILKNIKSGHIMGVSYDFHNLLENLGKGLSGQNGYRLNPEIYTKLMGNCTSDRLEVLFNAIGLTEPFSDELGLNSELKAHFGEKAKGRVANRSKEKLNDQIILRNNIVHGELTLSIDLAGVQDTLGFFRALTAGLDEVARTKHN